MADRPRHRRSLLPIIVPVLALAAVVLVALGRWLDPVADGGWQDPLYTVLLAFSLDGTFLTSQSWLTVAGAFAAALAFYLAVLGSLWAVFRGHFGSWRAARQRDHVVVVGDGADAEELALALAPTVRVVLVSSRALDAPRVFRIERPGATSELIAAANVHKARAVVVMLDDEKLNAAIATSIASGCDGEAGPAIWCRVRDRLIADRVSGAELGASRILVFDEAQMMARDVFARHPAHAIAERMAAGRVHFLVIGFGGLGQAMAEEAIFSGLASGLGKPMITIIDKHAATAEAIYRATRPALDSAADVAFIGAELITAQNAPVLMGSTLAQLAARDAVSPVTGILICLGSDADNIRVALALPDIRRREGRYFAPAFMRLRDPDAESVVFAGAADNVVDPNTGVIAIERPTALMASDILDSAQRDAAAQRLHDVYTRNAARSSAAGSEWNRLAETYRRANRRSADHIAAKLFSLGLASEHDAHTPVTVRRSAHQHVIAPLLGGDSDALEQLAALEHRRWSADRIIDGWSYDAQRDDDRKHHPLLEHGEYSRLAESEQQKDRDQVRTVLSSVVTDDREGAMTEIRVALAGHRNLAPAEEQRAVAALVERLRQLLGDRDRVVTLVSPLAPGADLALSEAVAVALGGHVGELRLIVPEAVPYRVVLDVAAGELASDDQGRKAIVDELLKRRAALFARFARVDIVRIGFAGKTDDSYHRDTAQFEQGLARANAYLARRCDLLAVLWDGQAGRGLGGTGDLVNYWRDPASIPPALDPGLSPVRPAAVNREGALLVGQVQRS
ncbi:MAG: hypothetical protein EOP22_09720 [Hyphomicrobiales bacterium]|nr:MAG: hypothetical protein EOP22_09720 [Hyphomicrobiales bacterium]